MSHSPERAEKNCLNCGTTVAGRYCQHCGQENVASHMHFFALTQHFIFDIFHFDGKFFDTLRYLFFKPGKVAKEYISGRRVKYLDPIRMYLFTSALFFLLFFSFSKTIDFLDLSEGRFLSPAERLRVAMELSANGALKGGNTALQQNMALLLDSTQRIALVKPSDSVNATPITYKGAQYVLSSETDKTRFVPIKGGNDWLNKTLREKVNVFREKYGNNPDEGLGVLLDGFVHRLPYLLFLSLPFFAAILKLLYRRRKEFFYFDHAVFTLYHYVFSFILLLLVWGIISLNGKLHWGLLGWVSGLLIMSWPLHLIFGLKRFYVQGWGKTLVKFVLLNGMGLLVLLLLFMVFLFFSFLMM